MFLCVLLVVTIRKGLQADCCLFFFCRIQFIISFSSQCIIS